MKLGWVTAIASGLLLLAGSASADRFPAGKPPGAPAPGVDNFNARLAEASGEPNVANSLGRKVYAGYVVLMETAVADSADASKWSDVIVFKNRTAPVPVVGDTTKADSADFSSDTEAGITDADLPSGVTIANVKAGPVVYVLETGPESFNGAVYQAVNGNSLKSAVYYITSEVPGLTPVGMVLLVGVLGASGIWVLARRRRELT